MDDTQLGFCKSARLTTFPKLGEILRRKLDGANLIRFYDTDLGR